VSNVIPMPRDNAPEFKYPGVHQRVVIMGTTGTGKTQFGAWMLSEAPWNKQPYVIVDTKRDALLNAVDRIKEIGFNELPKHPGLYIIHPLPEVDDARFEQWLWKVWHRGKVGLYIDEAYMLPQDGKSPAMRAICVQGRSLKIPVISLTQRPAWVSRFIFSEASYYSYFHFNDAEDVKTARRWFPQVVIEQRLPKYWSAWYDQDQDASWHLQPVPDQDSILDRIDTRLNARRRAI